MPENLSAFGRLKRGWWQILLSVVVVVALIMLVMTPELAALSFLFDPVALDVAIVFLGTQLLLVNGQIRTFFATTSTKIMRRLGAGTLKR